MKAGSAFEDRQVDAVLVDAVTWSGLQKLPTFQGVLRVLYSSPSLPTPPVVAFGGVEPERSRKLGAVLSGMGTDEEDEEGRRLLQTLQVTGFKLASPEVMAKAVEAYEGR
jgi:ABC-type phosphate/phosphonate transport system substrate-binding protein